MNKESIFKLVLCAALVYFLNNERVFSQPGPFEEPPGTAAFSGQRQDEPHKGREGLVGILVLETLPQHERDALAKLREDDPQSFQEAIAQKVKEQGEYLKHLKETDPEQFDQALSAAHERIRQRCIAHQLTMESLNQQERQELETLRGQDREAFRQAVERKVREKQKYLDELKATDPQEYESLIQNGRLQSRKRKYFEEVGKEMIIKDLSPEEKEHLKNVRETDPQEFEKIVRQRFEDKKAYLAGLKESDPERFTEEMGRSKEDLMHRQRRERMGREIIFETLSAEEKDKLANLREDDPQSFREVTNKLIAEKKEYLDTLKESDPEKFKRIVSAAHERIRQRMEALRQEDPEKFKELMRHHKMMQQHREEQLCKENPEECQRRKSERNEHIKTMLQQLREDDPETFNDIREWMRQKRAEHRKDTQVPSQDE